MNAMTYRKRPVEIQAVRFEKPYKRVQDFCPTIRLIKSGMVGTKVGFAIIETLEGQMTAEVGDWIIRGVQGEFYPCKPDIFAATYELVETPDLAPHELAEVTRFGIHEEDQEDEQ